MTSIYDGTLTGHLSDEMLAGDDWIDGDLIALVGDLCREGRQGECLDRWIEVEVTTDPADAPEDCR